MSKLSRVFSRFDWVSFEDLSPPHLRLFVRVDVSVSGDVHSTRDFFRKYLQLIRLKETENRNFFILTLFLYLCGFYIMPEQTGDVSPDSGRV